MPRASLRLPLLLLLVCAPLSTAACAGRGDTSVDGEEDDTLAGTPSASHASALTGGQLVYVNFDGAHVDDCDGECSDAPTNRSWAIGAHFGKTSMDFAPYTSAAGKATILAGLRRSFARWRVDFTTTRPSAPPYTMVIVSPTGGAHHGVAPLDCGNANPNDIAFVYRTTLSSPDLVAREAAHELGHSFGLAHTASASEIMQWASSGSRFGVAPYDTAHESGKCFDGDVQDAPSLLDESLGTR